VAVKTIQTVAAQIQELKIKVVPASSTVLVKQKDAIKFSGGCSMNTPTWHASYRCFPPRQPRDTPEVVSL
jgi:hypothetical protein